MFKFHYVGTPANPSQSLILEASGGLFTEVPIGHEVQWWHMGEDGCMPQLVDIRGPYSHEGEVFDHFVAGHFQDWFASEVMDQIMVDEVPEPVQAQASVPYLPEFITLPLNRPQTAWSLPGYGKSPWPSTATN